ncbi:MAG: hypothetical protein JST84_30375 [Acidobacteria bacterium]|nr:hypothetical protein [Acidobacteriota bacterium]
MNRKQYAKVIFIALAVCFAARNLKALPEFMRVYAADPYAKAELRNQCATCHMNPAGGGERNAFGKAFAAAGNRITDSLRAQFPEKFLLPESSQALPVSFVQGSDSQAIIESNGKRFLIDTKTKTVKEVTESGAVVSSVRATAPPPPPPPVPGTVPADTDVYQQMDVRLVNLPTAKPIPKGALMSDFTHRFPFQDYELRDGTALWGLDGFAVPSFGFAYGLTDRIHIGGYRSPSVVGSPILLYAGASLLDENKGHPLSAMARVGVEGRGNFLRNFTTTVEVAMARSVTNKAQLYFVPAISFKNRPFGPIESNLVGQNTFALGLGGALNIRPTVALLAEANWRVNEKGRFGNTAPVYGFGIEKTTVSRRHSFSLTFSNAAGTTMSQRSATVRSLSRGADDSIRGLAIGFNISRRIF